MTSIERTSDHRASISPALAWAQLCTAVACVSIALILQLTGAAALALPIAGIGAAVFGIQITVHITPTARSAAEARPADAGRRPRWWRRT
ncbi:MULTISPECIES: hypothetical protein [Streptomyces]|uniref:hypothetical protein n=1 Tax=Streptomyces TaxID=1883 RepID=UPI001C4FFDF2|nr:MULTISPECIES: hypothetical protein [Streptomyces]MCX4714204.1 hypothetical protein [Streptomyces griseus]QXQ94915.1 hypothetical protein KV381_00295 [Streptomyces sp. WY228]QXR01241.1 hypothetical protein KV381_36210 [Streptomyces sp. WY228]